MSARQSLARLAALAGLAVAALVLAGCAASTSFVSQWGDDSWKGGKVQKVLVVGVVKDASLRRQFEDDFVRQASTAGVQAVPSYRFIAEDGPVSEAVLRKAVADSGADGVLVSAVQRVDQRVSVSPGYYAGPPIGFGYYGFYRWGYGAAYMPPTAYAYNVVYVETQFHAAKSETLLWAGTTQTIDPRNPGKDIPVFSKLILDALRARQLV
jgi:hypothetical protein